MLRCVAAWLVVVLLAGCATEPSAPVNLDHAPLLDGRALFGVDVPAADEVGVLELSDAMRKFVADNGGDIQVDWLRLKRLLRAMQEQGYMDVAYENDKTLTAAETFAHRSGNCLSFTNMFVALARASRLDAEYQIVDVPPTWDSLDGWIILNAHIDVIMRGVRMGSPGAGTFRRDYVVDFNMADFQTAYPRRTVKDRTAFALFYNNRAVEALRAGDIRTALANFKQSIAKDPRVPSTWVNLGALYSRQQQYDLARMAYERALDVQPSDKSALTNLARLYDQLGKTELAAAYRTRIHKYEEQNPYYHYALAERAFADEQWGVARNEIKRAIDLKRDDHRFFFLQSLIHYKLGDMVGARTSLVTAEALSDEDAVKQRYAEKLAALGLKSG